jgi:hypothetical protein
VVGQNKNAARDRGRNRAFRLLSAVSKVTDQAELIGVAVVEILDAASDVSSAGSIVCGGSSFPAYGRTSPTTIHSRAAHDRRHADELVRRGDLLTEHVRAVAAS